MSELMHIIVPVEWAETVRAHGLIEAVAEFTDEQDDHAVEHYIDEALTLRGRL